MTERTFSISELNNIIKNIFDAEELLHNIKIFGEVSGFSIMRGVAYFSLKDENSVLSCVMFGAEKYSFVKNGDLVMCQGTPKYYAKGGRLNFNCVSISPYGQGELFKNFLLLKAKLENEGLFDDSRKKRIPENIKKIGVVSSEEGAVIQDIINVATRRNPAINIVLFPSKVQGIGAEKEIVKGIKTLNTREDVDVIIVARGGGSMEDLQPFNTEVVARAIAESEKPIVSAVGHETDFSISDFVASLRAPTPSAAAELVVKNILSIKDSISQSLKRLKMMCTSFTKQLWLKQKNYAFSLEKSVLGVIVPKQQKLKNATKKLLQSIETAIQDRIIALNIQDVSLQKLNPNAILSMGYAKLAQAGKLIDSVAKVDINSQIDVQLKDGRIIAMPKEIREN